MKIIGAGLPRTATLTQKIALEMLGFGPCYHMVNILSDLDLVPRWADAFDTNVDWTAMFGDSQSTVDWPGSFFYRELVTAFPDAKVLLSVRDGAAWARSAGAKRAGARREAANAAASRGARMDRFMAGSILSGDRRNLS